MPFILVSGEIGEDTAVEAMRNGASDYLLKNNLARLVPALLHAIEAAETRRARVRADRELRRVASSACASSPSTCRPASRWSARRSRARSTTTSAAR